MNINLFLMLGGASGPSLSLSAASIVENSAQGTAVCTATPVRASNPGPVSIVSQTPANSLQMNVDGVTVEVGSAGLDYETDPTISVTFEYTDDDGTYQLLRTIYVTDVADGPTITGAASDIDTELGTPTVGFLTTFDARDVFGAHPLGQAMTFTVSHGSVDIDGFTVNWTPVDTDVSAGSLTFTLTAEDDDGQTLAVYSSPFAVEVSITPPSFSVADMIEGDSVTATSGSAVGATSSATYLLLNGVDVTADISGGTYVAPAVSSDATLTLAFYAYYDGVEFIEYASAVIYAVPADLGTTVQFDVLEDTTVPSLVSTSPTDNATGVSTVATPSFTISENAYFGTGNIVLRENNSGWADLEVFDVTTDIGGGAGTVSISGATITIEPTSAMTAGREYAIRVASTAVTDYAGNAYAGIADDTTFSFTTAAGASVPSAFTAGQWTLTDLATGGDARIAISALPSDGGSAITDLEYKKDAAAWTSLGGTTIGNYDLTGVFTDGVSANVLIRAVNAIGNGADSDTKSVTTSAPAGISAPTLLGTYVGTTNITQAETSSFTTSSTSILVIEVTTTNNDSASVEIGYTDITIGDASRSYGSGTSISTTPQRSQFSGRQNVHMFFYLTPAAASGQTIQVRFANTSRSTVIKVYEYEGADRATQDGGEASSSPNGNQTSSNVSLTTTYAGSAVHYAGIRNYDAAAITISGATELDQRTSGGTTAANDHHAWSAYEDAATTGSYGASASWTGSLSQAAVGCEVKAA